MVRIFKTELMCAKLHRYTQFSGIDTKKWENGQSLQTVNKHIYFRHPKTGTNRTIWII